MPRKTGTKIRAIHLAVLLALIAGFVLGTGVASADNSTDVLNGLRNQGWYISQTNEKAVGDLTKARDTLTGAIKTLNDRKYPAIIALLDPATLPADSNVCTNGSMSACGEYFVSSLASKGIQIAVVIDIPSRKVGLFSKQLNVTDANLLASDNTIKEILRQNRYVDAAVQLATNGADKIDANTKAANAAKSAITTQTKNEQNNSLVTSLIIVAVVILVVLGAFAFLVVTTKNVWKGKVEKLQKEAGEVGDMVYRLNDEVEYLQENVKQRAKDTFNQGAIQVTEANKAAAEIKSASTITLLFKWGQYNTKYQEALSKMESVRGTLDQVDQTVKQDIRQDMR